VRAPRSVAFSRVLRFRISRLGYRGLRGGTDLNALQRGLNGIDAAQQRRGWLGFPFAVVKKFGDDRAGNLAALIAYYGFFSLFPLLLVLVTIVSMVIEGNAKLQAKIIDSAVAQFPVVGEQIAKNVHAISGSGVALVVGIVGALWGGLGVVQAGQNAMNAVWNVPYKDQPNFWKSRLRSLILLFALGVFVLASSVLSGFGSAGGGTPAIHVLAVLLSVLLNVAVFLAAFRILTAEDVTWGDVFPGALCGAIVWSGLQYLGAYLVSHQLSKASAVYGVFAVVIGLLWWIYLGAQVALFSAEINVVRKRNLWPRSLTQPPLTTADKRALEQLAKEEERRPEQQVNVRFAEGASSDEASRRGAEADGEAEEKRAEGGPGASEPRRPVTR
jgi:YihY family inner membrane protein